MATLALLLTLGLTAPGDATFDQDTSGWRPRATSIQVSRATPGHDGTGGALRVRGRIADGYNYAVGANLPLTAGQSYRLSAWLRLEKLGQGTPAPFLKCEFMAADGRALGRANTGEAEIGRLGAWQQIEGEFTAPAEATAGWVAIEKGTDAPCEIDLLLDDVRLEPIARLTAADRFSLEPTPAMVALRGQHPRLLLTPARAAELRGRLGTTHRPIWDRLRPAIERYAASKPPGYEGKTDSSGDEQLWQRGVGNAMPYLALGWLMTREPRYLDAASAWATASCGYPTWGLKGIDGMDLATGHQMLGLAVIYDWCGADLPEPTRRLIRETLLRRGGRQYEAAATGEVWWSKSYLQNHQWVSTTGLAAAGLALWDEAPDTLRWVGLARDKYRTTWSALGSDGASHEGLGYWGYGVEYMLKYAALAHDLLGDDLYDHPWWRDTAAYRLYGSLPRAAWTSGNVLVDLADCPRGNWYGPEYMLRRLAAEYRDDTAQWLAQQVDDSNTTSAEASWLNLLWYDPTLTPRPPDNLPTLRHFEDLGIVSARSDWSGRESLLYLRCGPPLGHEAGGKFGYDAGSGHVHPDLNHFSLFGAGAWLLRDDGYSAKWTRQHNTLLVGGRGQLGEGHMWFAGAPFMRLQPGPRILRVDSTPDLDTISADATSGYPADLGLRRFVRHWLFVKPNVLLVLDDVATAAPADLELHFFPEQTPTPEPDGFRIEAKGYRLRVTSLTPTDGVATEPVAIAGREGGQGTTRPALVLRRHADRWRQATAVAWSAAEARPEPVLLATDRERWIVTVGGRRIAWDWVTQRGQEDAGH